MYQYYIVDKYLECPQTQGKGWEHEVGMGNNVNGWEHGNSIIGNVNGGVWACEH